MYNSSQKYNDYIDIKNLLSRLDQESLFHKYTGIYPSNISTTRYYSLFRHDRKPGCSFRWHSGKLYFVDNARFRNKLWFDIIDCIEILHNCSTKEAINMIVNENPIDKNYIINSTTTIKIKPEIRFKYKPFEEDNLFGISPKHLNNENIYLVTDYWIKKSNDWEYNNIHNPRKTVCIAYHFPHNNNVKLYFPNEVNYRFYTNCDDNDVYGMYKLDYYLEKNDNFLIITKSQKDRILLDYVYGYNAIAVQSETSINLPKDVVTKIHKFKQALILFDHDNTGQQFAAKLSEKLDIPWTNVIIAKDVYESTQKYGVDATSKILKHITQWN